jgi:hypothetical protein
VKSEVIRRSLEDIIRELSPLMVKTLDQQIEEIRNIIEKVQQEYEINKSSTDNGNGSTRESLFKELVERFIRLTNYIDNLR